MSNSQSSADDILKSFIIGAFVGSVVAALITPYRGKEVVNELEYQYHSHIGNSPCSWKQFKRDSQKRIITLAEHIKIRVDNLTKKFDDITNEGIGALLEDEIV